MNDNARMEILKIISDGVWYNAMGCDLNPEESGFVDFRNAVLCGALASDRLIELDDRPEDCIWIRITQAGREALALHSAPAEPDEMNHKSSQEING